MSEQTLTTTDNRTGKSYTLPIENGTVRAMDLRQIKTDTDHFGLMTYDPALMNTASTKSAITFIDGDKGFWSIAATQSNNSRRTATTCKSHT